MKSMTLKLGPECIETRSRQEYRKLLSMALGEKGLSSGDTLQTVKDKFELITGFILVTDFANLRNHRPELNGNTEIAVNITRDAAGAYSVSSPI